MAFCCAVEPLDFSVPETQSLFVVEDEESPLALVLPLLVAPPGEVQAAIASPQATTPAATATRVIFTIEFSLVGCRCRDRR